MSMLHNKCNARFAELQTAVGDLVAERDALKAEVATLRNDNIVLTRNKSRIMELLKLFDDVATNGTGLLKVERVNSEEVFLWHQG